MAAEVGVTRQVWRRAELGTAVPHPGNRKRIADYFGCQVTDIWPVEEEVPA